MSRITFKATSHWQNWKLPRNTFITILREKRCQSTWSQKLDELTLMVAIIDAWRSNGRFSSGEKSSWTSTTCSSFSQSSTFAAGRIETPAPNTHTHTPKLLKNAADQQLKATKIVRESLWTQAKECFLPGVGRGHLKWNVAPPITSFISKLHSASSFLVSQLWKDRHLLVRVKAGWIWDSLNFPFSNFSTSQEVAKPLRRENHWKETHAPPWRNRLLCCASGLRRERLFF